MASKKGFWVRHLNPWVPLHLKSVPPEYVSWVSIIRKQASPDQCTPFPKLLGCVHSTWVITKSLSQNAGSASQQRLLTQRSGHGHLRCCHSLTFNLTQQLTLLTQLLYSTANNHLSLALRAGICPSYSCTWHDPCLLPYLGPASAAMSVPSTPLVYLESGYTLACKPTHLKQNPFLLWQC